MQELINKVNELQENWYEFKQANDTKISMLEKRSRSDPLTDTKLNRINDAIDQCQDQISSMETVLARSATSCDSTKEQGQEMQEYKNLFSQYIKKGLDHNLHNMEKKLLSTQNDQEGGYLIPFPSQQYINQCLTGRSLMRQLCSSVSISTNSLEYIDEVGKIASGWVNEQAERPVTASPQLNKRQIYVHEMYAQPKATQKFLDDTSIDVASWLQDKIIENFADLEEDAFINGDGNGKPHGILSYNGKSEQYDNIEHITTGEKAKINIGDIIKVLYSLKSEYASKATFLTHRETLRAIRTLKDNAGHYIWQPKLSEASPDTVLGVPIVHSSYMPLPQSGKKSMVVADFKAAYQIIDRVGIRVLRDPFTEKPFVKFYTTKRVGGNVKTFEALKVLQVY